ncbi:hypothetical protein TorRG33x02_319640 [Trema orientale]|uniref:Uncharacterized protein n=1 Tax=Trema orientale TaxID=63057 RepID=A0A2P5BIN8_TREOI|nr:hypothetical protein TorRG33x02_319640 [Trema orientale]
MSTRSNMGRAGCNLGNTTAATGSALLQHEPACLAYYVRLIIVQPPKWYELEVIPDVLFMQSSLPKADQV